MKTDAQIFDELKAKIESTNNASTLKNMLLELIDNMDIRDLHRNYCCKQQS